MHKWTQANLAACERGKKKHLGILLYFSNMLDLLSSSQLFQKIIPQNLVTLGHFSPKKIPLYESYWVFFLCHQDVKSSTHQKNPITVQLSIYVMDVRFDTLIQWEFLLICLKFQNNFTLTLPNNKNLLLPSLFYLKTSFFRYFISPISSMRCLPSCSSSCLFGNEPI